MKKNLRPAKITEFSKQFIDNVRATRRAEINGYSIDKKILTKTDTWDLITSFFKNDNVAYQKLIKTEWKKNA